MFQLLTCFLYMAPNFLGDRSSFAIISKKFKFLKKNDFLQATTTAIKQQIQDNANQLTRETTSCAHNATCQFKQSFWKKMKTVHIHMLVRFQSNSRVTVLARMVLK